LIERAPTAWQTRDDQQIPVDVSYRRMADGSVHFELGAYESTLPLVIDPSLVYSTYLGGSSRDEAYRMAVDDTGSLYVVGLTTSTNFPTTTGSFQKTSPGGGGSNEDAFVVKLNPDGRSLAFSTYLGGKTDSDQGLGLALDSNKNIYITGSTSSSDFPVLNPIYTSGAGFVTKLNPTGNVLIYSTYMSGTVFPKSIAVDSAGNAYVAGVTAGTFPMTPGAFQTNCLNSNSQQYAFVTKVNAGGTTYNYSTCLSGSSSYSSANGVSVDDTGSAYVVGATNSSDFPTIAGAFQTASSTGGAFVSKLKPDGSGLVYSTFLGSAGPQYVVLDSARNAYVVGYTTSTSFPTTAGAFQTTAPTAANSAFVTKLNATGTALIYSTYLGSNTSNSEAYGAALDANNDLYVVGDTNGSGFPLVNPLQSTTTSGGVFVSQLNPVGSSLLFSTYLGGGMGIGIVVDMNGNAYVNGYTTAADFPTINAFQANAGGGEDAFIAKISPMDAPTATSTATNSPTASATLTYTATATSTTTRTQTTTSTTTLTNTASATISPTASNEWCKLKSSQKCAKL